MLVKCSGCAARLRIKDVNIKPGGSSFKCPRCSKVLFVQKPSKAVKDTYKHLSGQDDKASRDFMRHPAEKEKPKTSNIVNFFAVLLMIAIIGSVGTLVWAHIQAGKFGGPDHISVLDDTVYIHLNRTLYHLNASGELINSVKLSDLGIKGRSSDIQLLSDGTMLIGDWDNGTIKRCNIESLSCYIIAPPGDEALRVPFKFFADESSGQIYIIDTSRHKLFVQDIEGNSIKKLADVKTLLFPNDLLVDDDGLIHVANTNRHHIVTLKPDGERAQKIATPVKGKNSIGRSGQYWPVALAKSLEGNWWVLNADTHMKDADLIIYDKFGEARHRVKLPDKADPIDIALVGDKVLVTDFRLLKVYEVDTVTRRVINFGCTAFQSEFKKITDNKKKYQGTISSAIHILSIAFVGALGLVIFAIIDRRKKRDETREHMQSRLGTVPPAHIERSKAEIPPEIKKWNWGAFLITPIWGIGNKVYIALLVFVPFVNMIMPFYLGAKGNEIAWRKKEWDSVEHFKEVQKKWAYAGLIINLIAVLIIFLHPDLGFIFFD